jgi:hypothetical protein
MPDITIIKLKVRRGTDAQRKTVTLEQGEVGYTTDTKRVFVGNGISTGGDIVGNIVHSPLTTAGARTGLTNAVKGDLVYENNLLYQLSGTDYSQASNWGFIGLRADESTLTYTGSNLSIKNNGITGTKFAASAASGGLVATTNNGISANVDNITLFVTSTNKLSVGSIDQKNISSSALGNGLQGGSGTVISVKADLNYLGFNSTTLTLCALPPSTVTLATLNPSLTGAGLQISGSQLQTVVQDVDNVTLQRVVNTIQLKSLGSSGYAPFSNFNYNQYGQITSLSSTITDDLSCNRSSSDRLSVFNGNVFQTTFSNQTIVPVISTYGLSSTSTINLTSAGYIILNTGTYGTLAIPVLNVYPN